VIYLNTIIQPGARSGRVKIPASKSQAHRLLICAALGENEVTVSCDGISRDIAATMDCLNGLGANIVEEAPGELKVTPIREAPEGICRLACGESGSTLRFLIPVVGALGACAVFRMEGRLSQRPLAPLDQVLCAHGMKLKREGELLRCEGRLKSGTYEIPGNISSQYISGLLFALPLLEGESTLDVTGTIESASYIEMTEEALRQSGAIWEKRGNYYRISGGQRYDLTEECSVEGDYSNAAFFLCMGALSKQGVTVDGLSPDSRQGDRAILNVLKQLGASVEECGNSVKTKRVKLIGCTIDGAQIPDLIPVLSVVAAAAEGETRIVNAGRLRLKESDRLKSTTALLTALGGEVTELEDGLIIRGRKELKGGTIHSWGDHRIAMSAAVAACVCKDAVTVEDSQCVAKSYPRFWDDFSSLKGECI